MRFQFHTKAITGFFVLAFVLHELHELAHHFTVRILCGCWGVRDFLVWRTCASCTSETIPIIVGFAGPFITFCFMWAGFILLRPSNSLRRRTIGFALVMAALPLPRLLGAADRGGDEINTMRMVMDGQESFKGAPVIIGGLIILLCIIPPLWRAFHAIDKKQRVSLFLAFLIIPWLVDLIVVTKFLNGWLATDGFLMQPVYFGTPLLVIIWELMLLVAFILTCRKIKFLTNS